ncbi:hypothetical protein [Nocardia cyriacigeorgica]|uniref:hypothetical protein n=1 Tax=Nocardia cyriacigeorgica TaxID=135487 RepID=UPI002453F817|nr:hypothetical protein [Nocardia cyriacigeorgica]
MSTPENTSTNGTAIRAGQIWRDQRNRYMHVDSVDRDHYGSVTATCTVIAKIVGDRVTAPRNTIPMSAERLATFELVDTAPAPSGPDISEIAIDRERQIVTIDGTAHRYHVASSGPRITPGAVAGSAIVTVSFYVGQVRGA